jgi:hypothetical protein
MKATLENSLKTRAQLWLLGLLDARRLKKVPTHPSHLTQSSIPPSDTTFFIFHTSISLEMKSSGFCVQNYLCVAEHDKATVHDCGGYEEWISNHFVHISLLLNYFREIHILFETADVVGAVDMCALG